MKTTILSVCLPVGLMVMAVSAQAAGPQTSKTEKDFTGIVRSADLKEHTLETEGAITGKKFNLSPACTYVLPDQRAGTAGDLRPGENVTVSYRDVSGVLVANRVEQRAMRFAGRVDEIDFSKHTITVYIHALDKTFEVATNCLFILRNGQPGVFTNLHTGNQVLVTYEAPNGELVARRIAQTSVWFTGTLAAVDVGQGTLKAKAGFGVQQFTLAKNCAVVIHGRDAPLSDLKPDDKLAISYDVINGVNVASRILPTAEATNSVLTDEYSVDF